MKVVRSVGVCGVYCATGDVATKSGVCPHPLWYGTVWVMGSVGGCGCDDDR